MSRVMKMVNFFFVLVLFTSCAPAITPTIQMPLLQVATNTPIAVRDTATLISNTPTAIQTPLGVCNSLEGMGNIKAEGKIVFYNPDQGLYFYDVESGVEQLISNTIDALAPEASPDHKRIAYFDFRNQMGYVISANGSRVEPHIKGKFDGYFYGWLDNHKVIFVDRSRSDGSIITLGVDTGNISQTVTALQDLYNFGPNRWYASGDWPTVIFDSKLSRMVYMNTPDEAGKWGFTMRETGTLKLLWSRVSSDFGVQPKWSQNDEFAAVVITQDDEAGDQIYIIDREGQEVQVINTNSIGINVVEWSPDGKSLSYGSSDVLAIYDFVSNQLHEFRLPEEIWSIVWAPTGNQIAVESFLVDLSNGCAMPLESGDPWGPLAWLIEEP